MNATSPEYVGWNEKMLHNGACSSRQAVYRSRNGRGKRLPQRSVPILSRGRRRNFILRRGVYARVLRRRGNGLYLALGRALRRGEKSLSAVSSDCPTVWRRKTFRREFRSDLLRNGRRDLTASSRKNRLARLRSQQKLLVAKRSSRRKNSRIRFGEFRYSRKFTRACPHYRRRNRNRFGRR